MICFINRSTVDYDIRLQKYVLACQSQNVPYCVIAWDRVGNCSKMYPNEYQYKANAPYGYGWKNIFPLIGWMFFMWYYLIRLWGKYKVIHACNIENCISSYPMKLFGKKMVMDIYDTVKPGLEAKMARKIEGLILPSDVRLKQVGITKEECRNYLEVENVPYFSQKVEKKGYVEFPEKIHLAYVGVLNREIRGLENLVEMVKGDERFYLEMAGTGDGMDSELEEAAKVCSRIKYYGKVDYAKALQMESNADFIIALYYLKAKVHEYASPNKYYESLYLGKPIITSKNTLVGINVEKNNTGYTVGDTLEDLKELFNDIAKPEFLNEYEKKSNNCERVWNEKYSDYFTRVTGGGFYNDEDNSRGQKRITLLTLGSTGAGPVYSFEMAKALAQTGECKLQIIISEGLTNKNAWENEFRNSSVDFNIVKAYNHSKLSVMIQYFNYIRKCKIVNLIKDFHPDVLYVPFGLLWSRFIFAMIPSDIKIVSTIHDVTPHDRFNFGEEVSKLLTLGSNRYVDGWVILNKKDKPLVEGKYRKPVTVIPHASFGYYFKKNNEGVGQHLNYRIGFFGRIEPYKGLDLLVDAFEQLKTPNLELLIAGSGSIPVELQERIRNNKRIELINRYIKDEEFQPLLEKVDFVVLPYKRASQSGVIPMCFAGGKTVIATNVGALEEQVPTGTGIITSPNAADICAQIDDLYKKQDKISQLGSRAKLYAEEELSWDKSAKLLLEFIEKI